MVALGLRDVFEDKSRQRMSQHEHYTLTIEVAKADSYLVRATFSFLFFTSYHCSCLCDSPSALT